MNAVGELAVGADGILVATVLPEVPNDRRLLDVHARTLALDPALRVPEAPTRGHPALTRRS